SHKHPDKVPANWGIQMLRVYVAALVCMTLTACASGSAVKTSQNSAIIRATAAPVCGGIGAASVAEKQAAIETIRSGYDGYIITGGAAENNVQVTQSLGSATTYGRVYGNSWTANTTYTPQTFVSGNHAQSFSIVMFKAGEPGYANAIDAKSVLGVDWEKS